MGEIFVAIETESVVRSSASRFHESAKMPVALALQREIGSVDDHRYAFAVGSPDAEIDAVAFDQLGADGTPPCNSHGDYTISVDLLHLFDHSLVGRAGEIGLEWEKKQFTFAAIETRSNRVANALRARGFAKGDRLGVYLPNSVE